MVWYSSCFLCVDDALVCGRPVDTPTCEGGMAVWGRVCPCARELFAATPRLYSPIPLFPALQPDQLRGDSDLRPRIGELAGKRFQRAALLGGARLAKCATTGREGE